VYRAQSSPDAVSHSRPWKTVFRAAVRSRLVHFLILGGLLFAVAPRPESRRDIVFDSAAFDDLQRAQAQRLGAPVLEVRERDDVRTRAIEDEILYREALRLALDKDDNIVRQRLIQKVLFLAEDLAGVSRAPTEEELRRFFEATREQWTRPGRVRLIHVYAGPSHREELSALRPAVIAAEATVPGDPPALGEAFPLPRTVVMTRDELAETYGAVFADAVFALTPAAWSEPIESKFGWHLVHVLDRQDAGPATFEDVRSKLPLTYLVARKKQAAADFLRQAATRYRITVDGKRLTTLPTSGRIARERSSGPD
jgi:peptidyl-prolyl cis-trans isomerase C